MFIQGLDDVQGFQGIPAETTDLQDADLIDAVLFHIGQHVLNLLPLLVLLGSGNLVGEDLLNGPVHGRTVLGQLGNLPGVILTVGRYAA